MVLTEESKSLHENFQKPREQERHQKNAIEVTVCIRKVLVAPVLRDSKSLLQSRGSFYSRMMASLD